MIKHLIFLIAVSAMAQTADLLIDFEGSANGTQLSTSNGAASTHGGNGSWSSFSATSQITFAPASSACQTDGSQTQISNLLAPITVGATSYPGTGNLTIQYTASATSIVQGLYFFTPTTNTVAVGLWICWDIPNNDPGTYDLFEISNGPHFLIPNVTGGLLEVESTYGNSSKLSTSPNTPYYLEILYSAGTSVQDLMKVYDKTGTLLATLTSGTGTNTTKATFIAVGSGGDSPQTNGVHWWTDNIMVNYTSGTLPLDIPNPTGTALSGPRATSGPNARKLQ